MPRNDDRHTATRPILPFHCGARWRDDAATFGRVVPVKPREG
ncbi:hypothetical protein [Haladaptatus sp. W1]|nr:hypothetical protein [Haladaptatus sp. W1]